MSLLLRLATIREVDNRGKDFVVTLEAEVVALRAEVTKLKAALSVKALEESYR